MPILQSYEFQLAAVSGTFRRGDANGDAVVDLSDAVMILGCKFLGEECPTCRDAGDANDDGGLDVSDAVWLLSHLFLGGEPPRAPGKFRCGPDPSADSIPECVYDAC